MKIFFDHILFQQTDYNFNHTLVTAIFEKDEFDYALENGFFPDNFWLNENTKHSIRCKKPGEFVWIPVRSSRIVVKDFVLNKKDRRLLKNNVLTKNVKANEINYEEFYEVYLKYIRAKKFEDYKDNLQDFIDGFCRNDFEFLEYRLDNKLIGFCLIQVFQNSLVSYQFCWDYENSKLSLGKFSQIQEVEYAKSLGFDYVYIGCVAENAGIYKINFPGFEYYNSGKWRRKDSLIQKWLGNDSDCVSILELLCLEKEYIKDYSV